LINRWENPHVYYIVSLVYHGAHVRKSSLSLFLHNNELQTSQTCFSEHVCCLGPGWFLLYSQEKYIECPI
jgi:hypothetical protein